MPIAIASAPQIAGTIQMLLRTYSWMRHRVRQDIALLGGRGLRGPALQLRGAAAESAGRETIPCDATPTGLAIPVYTRGVAKVMISLPDELLCRIDERARRRKTTRSGLIRYLAEREIRSDAVTRTRKIRALLATAGAHGGESARDVREQRRAR